MADNLTPSQRRKTMQAVKGRNTSLERTLADAFRKRGWHCCRNSATLPGKPDFVFTKAKVVVFVDGDFWHGWRFPLWKATLTDYWQKKIGGNRNRDRRNFQRLRRAGWIVIRIWEHDVMKNIELAVNRVEKEL